jgi:hypothetical protein
MDALLCRYLSGQAIPTEEPHEAGHEAHWGSDRAQLFGVTSIQWTAALH